MFRRKGFVMILSIAMTAIIVLVAWAIVNLGCGEALQVRKRNDTEAAYYVACAGAERMYARLRGISNANGTASFPLSISSTNLAVGGTTVGSYAVTANDVTGTANQFMIVSDGTVNSRTVRVTAKYGYTASQYIGIPLGSKGSMSFTGNRWWFLTSWVYAEGPLESQSTIAPGSNTNSVYVQYSGDVIQNSTNLSEPRFWLGTTYDTNNNNEFAVDPDGKGYVTLADAQAQNKEAAFLADDNNSDGRVDGKDAFRYYYTSHLNSQYNLGIQEGGPNHYNGTQTFGPMAVPAGTRVIFVDGDANVVFNAQQWWGSTSDLTIVSTGDITVVQPVNGADDRLTLVAYGDTATGGINVGDLADVDGNFVSYSGGDFSAILGGSTNGAIYAGDNISVQTGLPSFLFNRDFNKGTDNWDVNRPIGLPPGFSTKMINFVIKAENLNPDTPSNPSFKPRWQRR